MPAGLTNRDPSQDQTDRQKTPQSHHGHPAIGPFHQFQSNVHRTTIKRPTTQTNKPKINHNIQSKHLPLFTNKQPPNPTAKMATKAHDAVHVINNLEEFSALAKAHKYLILDFTAEWCPPCRTIKPSFHNWAETYTADNLAYASVDVDTATDVALKFGISAMPTFVFVVDGEATGVDVLADAPPALVKSTAVVTAEDRLVAIRGALPPALLFALPKVAALAKADGGAEGKAEEVTEEATEEA